LLLIAASTATQWFSKYSAATTSKAKLLFELQGLGALTGLGRNARAGEMSQGEMSVSRYSLVHTHSCTHGSIAQHTACQRGEPAAEAGPCRPTNHLHSCSDNHGPCLSQANWPDLIWLTGAQISARPLPTYMRSSVLLL